MKKDQKRVGIYREKGDLTLVLIKGVNTLKSLLMHPKDKISTDQKKDIVYHWECQADGCNSSYIKETSRALGERVKEHSKVNNLGYT